MRLLPTPEGKNGVSVKITTTTVKSSDGKISFTALFETNSLVDLEWIEKSIVELKERLRPPPMAIPPRPQQRERGWTE